MHFVKSLVLGASLVVAALAQSQLGFTSVPTSVKAGTPTVLKWSGGDGSSVTITLKKGSPTDLKTVTIITGSATGNSYTWTPPKTLASGDDYAFQISQGLSDVNYSGLFSLSGGSANPSDKSVVSSVSSSIASSVSSSIASSISKSIASSITSASKSSSTASVASITSSLSSILSSISSIQSASNHTTTTVPVNATTSILIGTGIGTAASSGGTGIPISRNTTLSHATLKSTSTKTGTTTTGGPASTSASGTESPSGSGSARPNSAANLASPLAFVITAFVAIIYLG